MGPRRGKLSQAAPETSKTRAAAPKTSAPRLEDVQDGPRESPATAETTRPAVQPRGPTRASGSRRKEGAQASSQLGRRVSARDAGSSDAPASSGGAQCPAPAGCAVPSLATRDRTAGSSSLRSVVGKLKLKQEDISAAAEVVNKVVDRLLQGLQSLESASEFKGVDRLSTGSYYERVKISAPNEFDVMFKLEVPRIQLEEYCNSGAYYFVKFKRLSKEHPLNEFLEDISEHSQILSASKMLLKFRAIIRKEIGNIKDINISMQRKKTGSPAVTLLIQNPEEISVDIILALESKGSWPNCTQEGLPIQGWLGRKVRNHLRLEPFYLVPKPAKEGNGFRGETWRLSFSNIEKKILYDHGNSKTCCQSNVKCCRKDCLKLMKYLLEQLKKREIEKSEKKTQMKLDNFCSYHVKTAFFHMCTKYPSDSDWHPRNLELCFKNCVEYFLQCLKTEELYHFFIPQFNLFSQDRISKTSKKLLLEQIEYERNNGFPVFDEC